MTLDEAVDAYVAWLESLRPESLHRLDAFCAADVWFRDPFNDVRGIAQYRTVLAKMFEDLSEPSITITDRARSNQTCYLRWTFSFRSGGSKGRLRHIDGVSEVHLDASGKVTRHLDYWDAGGQVYEQIPLLGPLVRIVKRRLAAQP